MKQILKTITSSIIILSLLVSLFPETLINEVFAASTKATKGDVNGDKTINIVDVICLKSYLCDDQKNTIVTDNSDLNGDNNITNTDYKELTGYMLNKTIAFWCELEIDTDSDGLCDKYENFLNTDSKKSDTDGDGFTDYQELFLLNSSPLEMDENLGKKDFDSDKLTNSEEIELGTNPLVADSDNDGILDYDEINIYLSNPLSPDSDGDSLPDAWEIQLNINPSSAKSDGKTEDANRILEQILTDDIFPDINNSQNKSYIFSADVKASGYAKENFLACKSAYTDFIANRYIAGDIIDTSYIGGELQSVTVKFEIKSDPEDYCIFKYSDEYNTILPVKTEYSDNMLYYTDNECGTYCILDVNCWINNKNESEVYPISSELAFSTDNSVSTELDVAETNDQGIDIYFFKFFPGSGSRYDPKLLIDSECMKFLELDGNYYKEKMYYKNPDELLSGYITKILETGEEYQKDIHVYGIDECGNLSLDTKNDPEELKTIPYASDSKNQDRIKEVSTNYMDNFEILTNVNYNIPDEEHPAMKLVRKPYSLAGAFWSTPSSNRSDLIDEPFSELVKNNTQRKKYAVILDNGALPTCDNAEDAINDLKKSGVDITFFYCPGNANAQRYKELATDNKAYIWNELSVADIIINRILNQKSASSFMTDAFGNYTKTNLNASISEIQKFKKSPEILPKEILLIDTDEDGCCDFNEISMVECISNLMPVAEKNWFKKKYYGSSDEDSTVIDTYTLFFKSRPDSKDSDHDGLNDEKDINPAKALENGFTTNIKYDAQTSLNSMIPDCTRKQYETNSNFFFTLPSNYWEEVLILLINDFLYHCGIGASLTYFPNAGPLLMKYFLHVPEGYVQELACKYSEAITDTRAMRFSYYNDMNILMKNAEEYLSEGTSADLSSINGLSGVRYSWETDLLKVPFIMSKREMDYFVAVSCGGTSVKANVSCKKDENNQIYYEAKVKYYTFDSYDFDQGDIYFLHNAIGYGYAYPFYTYGLYETEIKWYKGSRYPAYENVSKVGLLNLTHEGISDNLFKEKIITEVIPGNCEPIEALINILYFDTKYLN